MSTREEVIKEALFMALIHSEDTVISDLFEDTPSYVSSRKANATHGYRIEQEKWEKMAWSEYIEDGTVSSNQNWKVVVRRPRSHASAAKSIK